jgi:hypothetical protein
VKRRSKRKRRSKTIPALGAAGLSLTLANQASIAAAAPALDPMTRVSHEIVLREDEIFDVSLATFYVFDKEKPGAFQSGRRIIRISGCCEFACLAGQAASESTYSSQVPYSPQVARPIRPVQKPVRKKR